MSTTPNTPTPDDAAAAAPGAVPALPTPPPVTRRAVAQRIQEARLIIASTWPYLAQAAFRLVPREMAGHERMKTLAVDKYWRLYYDKDYVMSLPLGQLALAIAGHELWHLLNRHHHRSLGDDQQIANLCEDMAINSTIEEVARAGKEYRKQNGKFELDIDINPGWWYPEKAPKECGGPFPAKLSYEEYRDLWKTPPPKPGSKTITIKVNGACAGDCGSGAAGPPQDYEDKPPGMTGDPDDVDGVTEAEAQVIGRAVAEQIKEQASRQPGTVPGGMERWAEFQLTPPKVDWRNKLRAKIRRAYDYVAGQVEPTYAKRNSRTPARWRRHGGGRRYRMPGSVSPVPRFAVVLDTSGSMQTTDYEAALSEVVGIARATNARGVWLLCCDTAASEFRFVKDPRRILLQGGGGTDMGTGINSAIEEGHGLIVVLTDGYTPWPDSIPRDIRVVVCLTQKPNGYNPPVWADTVYCGND